MEWLKELFDKLLSVFPQLSMVNPDEAGYRITLGKYIKPIKPGWYIYWPLIQELSLITITPQVKDVRIQSVWTSDYVNLCVGLAIKYRVKDAVAAQLKVQDYDQSLQNSALIAGIEFVTAHLKEELNIIKMNEALTKILRAKAYGWGIDVQDVSVTDVGKTRNIRLLTNAIISEMD